MTWRTFKTAVLHKMFALAGSDIMADAGVSQYLAALPAVAMEGIELIIAAGKGQAKVLEIDHRPPAEGGPARYALRQLSPDFYRLKADGVVLELPGGARLGNPDYELEGEDGLLLYSRSPGRCRVVYFARVPRLDMQTLDSFELPLSGGMAAALVLYAASQLYKDDDASVAGVYRNEFESALERTGVPGAAAVNEAFHSEGGWI